ncbi:unnamed protein product [Amoebophrya sp. A120]|nr:unnamed protein product [Amoebophrya sp. A120]|eukprot:GSA120T00006720001.1
MGIRDEHAQHASVATTAQASRTTSVIRGIQDLPHEVVFVILVFLDVPSLCQFERSSKNFGEATVRDYLRVWLNADVAAILRRSPSGPKGGRGGRRSNKNNISTAAFFAFPPPQQLCYSSAQSTMVATSASNVAGSRPKECAINTPGGAAPVTRRPRSWRQIKAWLCFWHEVVVTDRDSTTTLYQNGARAGQNTSSVADDEHEVDSSGEESTGLESPHAALPMEEDREGHGPLEMNFRNRQTGTSTGAVFFQPPSARPYVSFLDEVEQWLRAPSTLFEMLREIQCEGNAAATTGKETTSSPRTNVALAEDNRKRGTSLSFPILCDAIRWCEFVRGHYGSRAQHASLLAREEDRQHVKRKAELFNRIASLLEKLRSEELEGT